ncbi:MAG: hypothetical protein ACTSRK_05560 [Promethearchaeota archaeon]
MMISTSLAQLKTSYPTEKEIPRNLLNSPEEKLFNSESKLIPFREQYANEPKPHVIRHIHYNYGKIKRRRATMYYYNKQPVRLIYSGEKDPLIKQMMNDFPPRVNFPPNTVSSPIARSLREIGLKWIVERFFASMNYLTFDEPILEEVTPDCFVFPAAKAHKILEISGQKTEHPNNLTKLEIDGALFVEIKAYHQTTCIGEKELLQTYNYAIKGGKALLITSGEIGDLSSLDILNQNGKESTNDEETYSESDFEEFIKQVKKKNRKYLKNIDMSHSQDSFDTRGIYLSAHKKLKKMYRYTKNWPEKIQYSILQTPTQIIEFLTSKDKLGIVVPSAFKDLLIQRGMEPVANLFSQIQARYLEEIIINPEYLYPSSQSSS